MSETINIQVPIQIEHFSDQIVRARPLGPWRKLQLVGQNWEQLRKQLVRQLYKALPNILPTDLFAESLPAERQHWKASVELPPQERDARWTEPVQIELDTFRWQLGNGNCVVRIPAVNCVLFGKPEELQDEIVAEQARVALIRMAENQDLLSLRQRFSRRNFDYKSISLAVPIGGQADTKDKAKSERKKTSTLRSTANDLAKAKLSNVYGLDDKVAELADYLKGESPRSVLIVGPAGVGKTSLLYRLVALSKELGLGERRIWSTSGARIVSGMSGLGMWQQRCSKLIRQAHSTRAILHLGSLFELMEAGKIDGQPGVASMVRQSIARGKLLAIAECTPEHFAVIERDDPMLLRAFTRMDFKELGEPKIREILRAAADGEWAGQQIAYSDQAIEELYRLHSRFATYSALPAAALRLMQTLSEGQMAGSTIEADDVARAFAKQTGLPRFLVDDSVSLDLKAIASRLSSHVVGQVEPVELIVNLVATLKARMVRPGRPLASLMFIGPTGVGKTEMAKAIARLLYSDTSRMIRIDMSEYSSPWSAVKLIGKPGEGDGTLTSPIREQPFSVVLLDEFEKADPNVYDVLLQMLGEGRLTDAQGRLADFRNAVIIMTSNLGAETFRESYMGFGDGEAANWREHFQREVRKFVRPEFLGRLDRIVPFRPLPMNIVRQIAKRELDRLARRPGLKFSDSSLEFSDEAIDLLCELGYQPKYGARPLRRAIEQFIAVPLANALSDIHQDSTWTFQFHAAHGQIRIETKKKTTKTKSHKEIEADVVNFWQQLGRMARTARNCSPIRDLDNELERTCRQNEVLGKRLKQAQASRQVAALRTQLQQGQTIVETARLVRARLFEMVEQVCQRHLALLVAWHRNENIHWSEWQESGKVMLTQLRQTTEDVLRRRVSSSDVVTLVISGKGEPQLEILWKAYRMLASENKWNIESYLLQAYDPRRDESTAAFRKRVSERKINTSKPTEQQPTFRLISSHETGQGPKKLADAFRHDGSNDFNTQLPHASGFAMQFQGDSVERWLENEGGIIHFYDSSATGAKRRLRFRVNVFTDRLSEITLPNHWLELTSASEKDPRRVFDAVLQQVSNGEDIVASYAQGKQTEGLVSVMREEHERALWQAIGYQGIPSGAKLNNVDLDFDIPF